MYSILIFLHSLMRWLVLISLVYAVWLAAVGFWQQKPFTAKDNAVRHWTATIAHIQLMLGILLYVKSPVMAYFWHNRAEAVNNLQVTFFALILIFIAIPWPFSPLVARPYIR